jgi:Calcineurin-like phosphoesterase
LPPARSSFWPALIGGGLILLALIALPDDSKGEVTYTIPFAASEDTFVKSTRATTNYGQDATLQMDSQPSTKRVLIRFPVSGIPSTATIKSATLRVFVVDKSDQSGIIHRVNGAWTEASTTWRDAPAVGSEVSRISGSASAGTWKEANVTSAVTANGNINFYLLTSSTDGIDYASSESGSRQPGLVVTWSVPSSDPQATPGATPRPTTAPTPGPTAAPSPISGTGISYYVDSAAGNDSNNGTSPNSAWRTLGKAGTAPLTAGDQLLFKRGGTWSGTLTVSKVGTPEKPIVVGAYGSGALPMVCLSITGSRIIVTQLHANNCSWAGIRLATNATFNRIDTNLITGNVAGVHVNSGSSDNTIVGNTIRDNNRMSVLTQGGDDDSGAFGVLLNGDRNEVMNNLISGSDTFSYDYGRDGGAVEIYGGQGNHVHHNMAIDNDAFTELGNSRSRDNTFAYNVVRSSLAQSIFVVTRGGNSGYGPVANTRLLNNSVFLTGSSSQGFVCHAGCNTSVLHMRNNIIHAVMKAGYADGAIDEDYGVYSGGQVQFSRGPNSVVTNPMFANPAAGDLHLTAASPAVDTAVNAGYSVDLDGAHVPHDGNGDGVIAPDRGAYEKAAPAPVVTPPPPTPAPTPRQTAAPTAGPTPGAGPGPVAGDVTLVGAGDIAGCGTNGDEQVASLLDGIPGTIFTLGDNVYEDGSAQQFADCFSGSWGRHKNRIKPAPGNHDYHTSGGSGYYGYFGDAATPLQPGCRNACNGWYSYNEGNWHIIVLNSECATSYNACDEAAMLAWLEQDLRANSASCTLAMWHRPVLTIGPHSNDEGSLKPFWRMLYDYNADVVLTGHEHSYARYAPLNREANGVDGARGVRQIVVGTGGKGLTTSSRAGSTPGLEVWQDASTANTLGVLKLTLGAGSYNWQFVPVAGKSFTDSGTTNCH